MKNDISLITPISKDVLSVKIADAICNYIAANHLNPGDKLPPERQLSERFRTSRHSVREALRVLEEHGVIEVRMGSGTYVAHTKRPGSLYLEILRINYLEMLSVKTELEKYAIRCFIGIVSQEQMEQLDRILKRLEGCLTDGAFSSLKDKEFHYYIANHCGNKMLAQMIEKMIETFDEYYSYFPQASQMCLDTIPFHREILEAIRAKDIPRAMEACDFIQKTDVKIIKNSQNPVLQEENVDKK